MENDSLYLRFYDMLVLAGSIDSLREKWKAVLLESERLSPAALSELWEVYLDQYGSIESLTFAKGQNV